MILQLRILDSVVFKRDMDVGRQDGHHLQTELDLTREQWRVNDDKNAAKVVCLQVCLSAIVPHVIQKADKLRWVYVHRSMAVFDFYRRNQHTLAF